MSTSDLIDAVLKKVPNADPEMVLDLIVSCKADLNRVFSLLGVQSQSRKRQMTFDSHTTLTPAKVTKTSAEIVHLYTPEQVANADICCSMHPDFLDPSVANQLAVDLEAASKSWPHRKFYLFEREVTSGHSAVLYTSNKAIFEGNEPMSYQGEPVNLKNIRLMTPEMLRAREKIEELVCNNWSPNWHSEICVVNRFGGPKEKLDYHSDQLTHLGRRPIIVSLTLGCTREFRIKDRCVPPRRPVYAIHIPHNSVLVMHGGCQERFKHCVPAVSSVEADPLIGTARISLTFRKYGNNVPVPRCNCDSPMILRTTLPDEKGRYKYIWQCAMPYQNKKGCNEIKRYDAMTS